MLLRTLFLLLVAIAGFAVETPQLGSGAAPIPAGLPPTGAAGGDLAGTYPNPTVTAARFATPGPIGSTVASTGAFSTLTDAGLTATRVTFAGTAGLLSDDASLTYTAASDLLVVNHNAAALPAVATGTGLQVGGVDGSGARIVVDAFAANPVFHGRRADTTALNPSATQSGEPICILAGSGYGATGYTANLAANIQLQAAENWTDSNQGTKILFQTTPLLSTTAATLFTINGAAASFAAACPLTQNAVSTITIDDAATNAVTALIQFNHTSTGTAANSFGTRVVFNLEDDGGTNRTAGQIDCQWATAASATRSSKFVFNVVNSTATTTAFTISNASATFASGFPVTISDTTASSTTAGALLIGTGTAATSVTIGAGAINTGSSITVAGRNNNSSTLTTAAPTGIVAFWRSGGTIGSSGDMILQSDLAANTGFVFRAGITTPITIANLQPAAVSAAQPAFVTVGTSTITGGVTDGYNGSHQLTPTYDAGTALTVTRHNYFLIDQITLTGAGPAAVTDAAVFRFNAAPGTHKALAADGAVAVTFTSLGPTGAQTTIQGWMKINVNGVLRYIPFW